jgi:hypothetical protein
MNYFLFCITILLPVLLNFSFCRFVCHYVLLSIFCFSNCLSYFFLSICLFSLVSLLVSCSLFPSFVLSFYLPVFLTVFPLFCQLVYLSYVCIAPTVFLLLCLSAYLSVHLYICMYVFNLLVGFFCLKNIIGLD